MDLSKNFMNYEQQSASSKNIICFTSFYYGTEKNLLMFCHLHMTNLMLSI